jgi:hypothetical protein
MYLEKTDIEQKLADRIKVAVAKKIGYDLDKAEVYKHDAMTFCRLIDSNIIGLHYIMDYDWSIEQAIRLADIAGIEISMTLKIN